MGEITGGSTVYRLSLSTTNHVDPVENDQKTENKPNSLPQMGKGKITFPAKEEEWEREDFPSNLEEDLKELERTANLMRPKKFKFYFRALVTVLVTVALMLIAVFAWWLVYGI